MNQDIPKTLVHFHGKPMIDYLLDAVHHSGITTKPILVVGYQKELVMEHVGDAALYAVQTEQLGTGHAPRCAESLIEADTDTVLILFGDAPAVTGAMISNLIATHQASNCVMTMGTVTIPSYNDWYVVFTNFGRILRDEHGVITGNVEYKDATDEQKKIHEVNPVYFCFNKKWLFENLALLTNTNAQGEYYLTDLVNRAAANRGIASVPISPEEALGVNSIEELQQLEKIVKK